jgi:hypothetical protein
MTPTQKGAFCGKCSLEVYDFSNSSGDEIRDILKLNVGSKVCGRLAPEQLNDLNNNFNAWQVNSKRSFQSALVFSLIVAFGMTLFSCEEDEEVQDIGRIQEIGMFFLKDEAPAPIEIKEIILVEELVEVERAIIETPRSITSTGVIVEEEELVMGKMVQYTEPLIRENLEVTKVVIASILGGMGFSTAYQDYLEELPEAIDADGIQQFDFSAMAFPNPAFEKTILKIVMPEKEKVSIRLFSLSGQFIKDVNSKRLKKGETNIEIGLIDLPKGTYIISIASDNYNESVKFIKR